MNPVNNVNNTAPVGSVNQPQSGKRTDADAADWFSMSELQAGQTISATSLFDAGATVEDIASQVLSHISEPGNP